MCAVARDCLFKRNKAMTCFDMKKMLFKLRHFGAETTAAVAIVFALSIPMFIGAAGVAVDLAQAYNVKNRLANAVDKAALAAGSTTGTAEEIETQVNNFITANYPEGSLGDTFDVDVVLGDGTVTVSASARVKTSFMSIMGTEYLDVHQETVVKRELGGVEVVLVLDVTGSMAGNNISALRTASTNFLNIMFSRIDDPEYLKIGIVPFSASVNVGSYGLGLNPDGSAYDTGFVDHPATDDYINPASNINYNSGTSGTTNHWRGCILERGGGDDVTDDASPNWEMYRYPRICGSYYSNGTCRSYSNNNPNRGCTNNRLVPLTNNQTALQNAINGLQATGNTYINVGLVWGWRVISPTYPFTEGAAYDDVDWSKTIVLMTDGDNVPYNQYSAYGSYPGLSDNNLDSKVTTVCNNVKAQGVTLYTITFQSGISNSTRTLFRNCATKEEFYFDAPSNQDLVEVFENIANQLSQLHIVK